MGLVAKCDRWMEAVRDLLDQEHAYFPRAAIGDLLSETIETATVSWNWSEAGSFGCEFDFDVASGGWSMLTVPAPLVRRMQRRHPLVQWFGVSGDPTPTTVGRLPRAVAPAVDFALLTETLGPGGFEQQLSIPYHLSGDEHRAFVLARAGDDFPQEDVALARRIQPLLDLVNRQVRASQGRRADRAAAAGLTPREVAVLRLLADGRTAVAIGRRLGISPRTVTCHLEHVYRKLGVADRLQAVLAAQALGLVGRGPDGAPASPRPAAPAGRRPPAEVVEERGMREDGHRWMLLVDDPDDPDDPWRPSPSEGSRWAHERIVQEDGFLESVWSR